MNSLHRGLRLLAWSSGAIAVVLLIGFRVIADPPATPAPKLRPQVLAVLTDGRRIEGVLERFDDGEYWLLVNGQKQTFNERHIARLEFRVPGAKPAQSDEDRQMNDLIARFLGTRFLPETPREKVDTSIISDVAALGPKVVRPLLKAYCKKQSDYQAVGEVLKQIGPEIFPELVECVREDQGRCVRFPAWWALRESRSRAVSFVQGMLTDKDPRIRLLAMEVLYAWCGTDVPFPKSLDMSMIQILDDPDDDVRASAPHVLAAIGFRSKLTLPTLLRIMEDDRYASVRGNAVSALGYLGRELKASDPDLASIVTAFSQAVTEDQSLTVRIYSAYYLGEFGPAAAAAIPALQRATDDKKSQVREAAETALPKVKGEVKSKKR